MDLVVKPSSYTSSSGLRKAGGVVSDQFPAGLRVLVVDDDPTCLRILEKMLMYCLYEVTTCNRAEVALQFLRDNKNGYDIVISDVHMPDMDGFKLLEYIGLEMDLPVIMMSADYSKHVVMKGVTHGACDYLIKPVRMEALKNMWQHVVRKKKHEWKDRDFEPSGSAENGERLQKLSPDDLDLSPSVNEGNWKNSKKRKDDEEDAEERDDTSTLKKPRVVWSVELHQQFVNAVNHLGIDKAVPKKILELMNVPGLTRENVASHLQKYRLYLRRLSGVSQHQNGLNNSFMGPPDMTFGPLSSLNSIDLQALAASGQIPPQSLATIQAASFSRANTKTTLPGPLVDQRNIFCFENPKLRYVEGGPQNNQSTKQLNLLHGIPTNMDSKQLASLHQSAQSFGNVNLRVETQKSQCSSLLTPIVQTLRPPPQILNNVNKTHGADNGHSSVRQSVLSQAIPDSSLLSQSGGIENVCGLSSYNSIPKASTVVDFSRMQNLEFSGNNSFAPSLTSSGTSNLTCKLQDEAVKSNVKGSTSSFLPSYDVFGDLNHIKSQDWSLPNNGSSSENQPVLNVQGGLNVSPSMLTQTGFSSNQNNGLLRISSSNRTTFSSSEGLGNNPIIDHPIISSSIADNSLRIKAERLPDLGFQNGLFNEHYGQDDLMSAMLKQQETMATSDREFGFDGYHMGNLAV